MPKRISKKDIWNLPELRGRYLTIQALHDSSIKALPTDRIYILAEKHQITGKELSFAYDLLAGTIKMRAAIDNIIHKIADRNTKNIQPRLLTILRIGLYQLLFDDAVPDFAAVDTSCKLADVFGGKRQIDFVNAILRKVQKSIEERNVRLQSAEPEYTLPVDLNVGIRFNKKILPSIENIDSFLAKAYSYPKWIATRWYARFGLDLTKRIMTAGNLRPLFTLRANRLKLKAPDPAEELVLKLSKEGCRASKINNIFVKLIESQKPISTLQAFKEGLFQVQDITSSILVENLPIKEGTKILDLCAGLGTKTTQLAEKTAEKVSIYATDINIQKLQRLKENAERLALKSIKILKYEKALSGTYNNYFDIVILDVPCSNSGVFDRRPEARWRISPKSIDELSCKGLSLLETSLRLVKGKGSIIGFSSCSIEEEENQLVVREFMKRHPSKILFEGQNLPTIDTDLQRTFLTGGYWAAIEL